MGYIGSDYTQQLTTPAIDYFSGNGVTTTFTLTRPVTSVFSVEVVVNGVQQNPRTAYTINQAGNIVFDGAPSSGVNNIYVMYNSLVSQFVVPSPGTVQPNSLSGPNAPTWNTAGDLILAGALVAVRPENVQTGSYTLQLSDNGDVVAMNNAGTANVIIPPDSTANFPIGSVVWICRIGSGTTTLTAGAGVSLSKTGNFALNEEIYVRKRAANTWIVVDAPSKPVGTGGTLTVSGGYNIHTFSSVGASNFTLS